MRALNSRRSGDKRMEMPNLTKFADPSVMKALLTERLPLLCPDSGTITSCHVQHVRYSPKKQPENESLVACYHLGVIDKDSSLSEHWSFTVRPFVTDEARKRSTAWLSTSQAQKHFMPCRIISAI